MRYRIKVITTRGGVRYVPQRKGWLGWVTLFVAQYVEWNITTEARARALIAVDYTRRLHEQRTAKPRYIPVEPVALTRPA